MNPLSKFLKGPITVEQAGPNPYESGGFQITVGELSVIEMASVSIEDDNTPYKLGSLIDGNKVTVKVYKMVADTSTGAITASEATGDDLSGLAFKVIAWGH